MTKIAGPLAGIKFVDGLVPVIAQDDATGKVLMLAWANLEALDQSLKTGKMTYFSRSRQELWTKGATSGNHQALVRLELDCDGDAILATVRQTGPACHQGTSTCWGEAEATVLHQIERLAAARKARPQGRYTDSLLADPKLAGEKIVEEANEVAAVIRGDPNEDSMVHEAADLLYHLVVGLAGHGTKIDAVLEELARRQ